MSDHDGWPLRETTTSGHNERPPVHETTSKQPPRALCAQHTQRRGGHRQVVIGAGAALVEVRGDAGEEGKQPRLAKVDLEPAILAALPSAPSTAYSTAFSSRVHEGLIDAEYLRARHAILQLTCETVVLQRTDPVRTTFQPWLVAGDHSPTERENKSPHRPAITTPPYTGGRFSSTRALRNARGRVLPCSFRRAASSVRH